MQPDKDLEHVSAFLLDLYMLQVCVVIKLKGVHIRLNSCNFEWLFEGKGVRENSFAFSFLKCFGYMPNRLCYHREHFTCICCSFKCR